MNILHVLTLGSATGRYGGPFDVASAQVGTLKRFGLEAVLLHGVIIADEPEEIQEVPTIPVKVHRVMPGPEFCVLFSAAMARSLVKRIRSASIVHVHLGREIVPLLAAVISLLWSRKLVIQTHGMIGINKKLLVRILDSLITRRVVSRANLIVLLTEREGIDLCQWLGKALPTTLILGNGVDLSSLPKIPDRPNPDNEVLFMARFHKRKRATDFAEAARKAHEMRSEARYVAVGPDGGDLARVRKLALHVGILDIRPPVAPSQVARRLLSARIFVQCSSNEPWGNVLVTALSLGIPCIVTASAALAPSISEYHAGIVVPDESPDHIALAADEILHDDTLWQDLSHGAFRLSRDKFDLKLLGHQLIDAYLIM